MSDDNFSNSNELSQKPKKLLRIISIIILVLLSGGVVFALLNFHITRVEKDLTNEIAIINLKIQEIKSNQEELLSNKVNIGNDPVWLTYSDQDISFQYPKTLCGTSWQAEWDRFSCDKDWKVERTIGNFSSSEYAGGEQDSMGKYIQIMPSYSSFGSEFGGDIQLAFVEQAKFNESISERNYEQKTTKKGYTLYAAGKINEYGEFENYYLTNGTKYLVVTNNFTTKYPEYLSFLLDSIELK